MKQDQISVQSEQLQAGSSFAIEGRPDVSIGDLLNAVPEDAPSAEMDSIGFPAVGIGADLPEPAWQVGASRGEASGVAEDDLGESLSGAAIEAVDCRAEDGRPDPLPSSLARPPASASAMDPARAIQLALVNVEKRARAHGRADVLLLLDELSLFAQEPDWTQRTEQKLTEVFTLISVPPAQ